MDKVTFAEIFIKDGNSYTSEYNQVLTRVSENLYTLKTENGEIKEFSRRSAHRLYNCMTGWKYEKYTSEIPPMENPELWKPAKKIITPLPKVELPKEIHRVPIKLPKFKKVKTIMPTNKAHNDSYYKKNQAKDQVKELTKDLTTEQIIQLAKEHNLTWKEHSHAGINLMRVKMVMAKAIEEKRW